MTLRKHIINLLLKIGLTQSEAEMYLLASRQPRISLREIQEKTRYSTATVYRAFERLRELGLITSSPKNWRKNIEAVSLRNVGEKIAKEYRKLRKVEQELKNLDNIFQMTSNMDVEEPVEVLNDNNMIVDKCFEILNRPWDQFQAYGEGDVLADVLGKDADRQFINIRRRKGKKCLLVLTELGPYASELVRNSPLDLRETRFKNEPSLHNSMNYIYGDEVTLWFRDPKLGNRALVIKDPSLVRMHKFMFNTLLQQSR